MGGKTLRDLGAMVAYQSNLLLYCRQEPQPQWFAVKMHQRTSNHVSIDLMESATSMKDPSMWFMEGEMSTGLNCKEQHVSVETTSSSVLMLSGTSQLPLPSQLSELAQRLQDLRLRVGDGTAVSSMCRGRPTAQQLPVLRQPQAEAAAESARHMADVPEVRTPDELPLEEANGRSAPINGTTSPFDLSGLAGDREGDASKSGDREDCHRK